MKGKRQRHQGAFKAKVGLEALMGQKTVSEIAREYQVHPVQISQWKRAIVERLPELFERGSTSQNPTGEAELARLEQKVGQLTMELDWLKKKSRQLGL